MRRSSTGLMSGLTRLTAAVTLVGALVVLPVAVWRGIGGVGAAGGTALDWRQVFLGARAGVIDADTVVALGLIVFTALWAWFAVTAVAEIARVVAWRQRPAATLPPVPPSPSGAIRRLVRAAMVSTSTVVGAGLVSLAGASGVRAAAPMAASASPAPASAASMTTAVASGAGSTFGDHTSTIAVPGVLRSSGRDTPYSVAVRLGDPLLRDRIIELNQGATAPDGSTWTGGVFPAGMVVAVPEGMYEHRETTWVTYTVAEGDSVYRIATRLADGDNRRVRDIADAIIDRNLGRVMVDGTAFDDPSLVRIGWQLDVPTVAPSAASTSTSISTSTSTTVAEATTSTAGADRWGGTHVVEPGESYWSIAEQHVDPPADAARVAELTRDLVDHNAPLLGHDLETMLHPGDPVELPTVTERDAPAAPDVIVRPPAAAGATDTNDANGAIGAVDGNDTTTTTSPADRADPGDDGAPIATDSEASESLDSDLGGAVTTDGAVDTVDIVDGAGITTDEATAADETVNEQAAPILELSDPAPTEGASSGDATTAAGAPAPVSAGSSREVEGAGVPTRSPVTTSLAAAVLLCAGALGLVESRRRQQLRRAGTDTQVPEPSLVDVEIERLIRSLDATQRAVRLDLALRTAGHLLVGTGGFVLAAIVAGDGAVTVVLDRPGRVPTAPWQPGVTPDRWTLAADVTDEMLAPMSRLAGQPCPAVVHLGRLVSDSVDPTGGCDGDLFIDLEAFGLVCIDADAETDATAGAEAIVRAIATSLAASPVGETLRLITHDLDPSVHLGNLNAERARDFDEALDLAASALGSTPMAIGHRRTAELRSRGRRRRGLGARRRGVRRTGSLADRAARTDRRHPWRRPGTRRRAPSRRRGCFADRARHPPRMGDGPVGSHGRAGRARTTPRRRPASPARRGRATRARDPGDHPTDADPRSVRRTDVGADGAGGGRRRRRRAAMAWSSTSTAANRSSSSPGWPSTETRRPAAAPAPHCGSSTCATPRSPTW